MHKGVYCLLLRCTTAQKIKIGAIGEIEFDKGWYVYVGSALGSGGLSRVERHIRFYRERYRKPKWHIDYLMEKIRLEEVVCAETEERLECILAKNVGGAGISKFGCSDCFCETHLFYRKDSPLEEILTAFEKTGLKANVHKIV
ncbi:MAG: GIY-YIG nuclease family protein [Methanocorpusculum sp.]|nr:GIY-YIG nuclease family protein [Methanocorpusculum sp.]